MNCKPGDLAYIVCGGQAGAVVTVESAADPFPDAAPAWVATSRERLEVINRRSRQQSMNNRFRVRDSWLRPIAGPSIDIDEETREELPA